MAELRENPICGKWVIIATERAARPHDFQTSRDEPEGGFCPFCEGNEARTPPEIDAVRPLDTEPNSPGWKVRVVENKFPALRPNGVPTAHGSWHQHRIQGVGAHEVIIETPEHVVSPPDMPTEDFALVFRTYRGRLRALGEDDRLAYVMVFKNVGKRAGASLEHSHSQVVAVPVMPKQVAEEISRCERYYSYRSRCLFCDILEEELEQGERVVMESANFAVLSPFASSFPFEMWVVPKFHSGRFQDVTDQQCAEAAAVLQEAIARLELCLGNPPYNYAVHGAARAGVDAYHWHIELIPRVTQVAGFEWGTGFYINPMEPEKATRHLREVSQEELSERLAVPCSERAGE